MDKQPFSVHDSWNQDTLRNSSLNGQASLVQSNMEQDPTANGAHDAKNETCTTFTCFPKLAVELRCKIWREVCFRRRNICIWFKELGQWVEEGEHGPEVSPFRAFMYLSDSTHPTILHVSHESRTEGLKHYTLDFGIENAHPRFTVSCPARTYINWKADRVCVNETSGFRSEPGLNILPRTYFTDDNEPSDFRSEPDLNKLHHFIDLCKERGLQSIAINLQNDLEKALLIAMSEGITSVREILLFNANPWIIQYQMLRKGAVLNFSTMTKSFIEHTMKQEQGVYRNSGDIEWQWHIHRSLPLMEVLISAERVLLDGFKERERKMAEKLGTNGGTAGAGTLEWARPHIKLCKAELKLLPK